MSANKSIIEEALLEAKQIEEAVKTNTKEILAQTMMPEIEDMVKESLTEDDLTETGEEQVTEDEESVTVDAQIDAVEDEESDEDEVEDDEEVAITVSDIETDDDEEIEMGGEIELPSIVDLTSSSDEEVIKVFKELSDNDEVEVVGDVVKIKATELNMTYLVGSHYFVPTEIGHLRRKMVDDRRKINDRPLRSRGVTLDPTNVFIDQLLRSLNFQRLTAKGVAVHPDNFSYLTQLDPRRERIQHFDRARRLCPEISHASLMVTR